MGECFAIETKTGRSEICPATGRRKIGLLFLVEATIG